jgi:threonine dehydrogenase-like Zn-dependent dehydrogenase
MEGPDMRALTWQGIENVQVTEVPDPRIEQPTDAVVRVTSTAICGSDLHLYKVLAPYLTPGDVLGHEFMGIVEEVGSGVSNLAVGDRVVVPFNISCGHCWMCSRGLFAQCETTQNRDQGKGASLFGYTSLYGAVPGGQAERVRVPHADFGPVKLPAEGSDERYLYLSDILPTAWQGVQYANVIGIDLIPERLAAAREAGAQTVDASSVGDVVEAVHDLTDGRGADGVLEAVGMEAHGNPIAEKVIGLASRLPKKIAQVAIENVGIDRLAALYTSFDIARRGGTVSISGVYGGTADPMPMMDLFDKGLTLRMGQCHVKRWTDDLLAIAQQDGDVLGLETLATHRVSLDEAPAMYELFQKKQDGVMKVVLTP